MLQKFQKVKSDHPINSKHQTSFTSPTIRQESTHTILEQLIHSFKVDEDNGTQKKFVTIDDKLFNPLLLFRESNDNSA